MNSYERVYSLLLEEALIAEQRRMTTRQKLGVTTALLGGLTAGVANVGNKTGVPPAVGASKAAATTTQRQQPALPDAPSVSQRTPAPPPPTTPRVRKLKDRAEDLKQKGMGFDKDPDAYMKSMFGVARQMPKGYDHTNDPEIKALEAKKRWERNFKANNNSGTKIGVWDDRKAELHLDRNTGEWKLGSFLDKSGKRIYDK